MAPIWERIKEIKPHSRRLFSMCEELGFIVETFDVILIVLCPRCRLMAVVSGGKVSCKRPKITLCPLGSSVKRVSDESVFFGGAN